MNYYILFYTTVENYIEQRVQFREEHLALAKQEFELGNLVLAGAFDDPADGAALIFKGETKKAAEKFAINDPYVKNGLIKEWKVREWKVVIGE